MAYTVNNPACSTQSFLTGTGQCSIDLDMHVGGFICSASKRFDDADIADIKNVLQAATMATGKNQIIPVPYFFKSEPANKEPKKDTGAAGHEVTAIDQLRIHKHTYLEGKACTAQQLRALNGRSDLAFVYFTKKNQIHFAKDGSGKYKGFTLDEFFGFSPATEISVGEALTHYYFTIAEKNINEWDNVAVVQLDFDPYAEIKGMVGLKLVSVTPKHTGLVFQVNYTCMGDANTNIYDDYKALITKSLFTATKGGVSKTIASLATDDVNKTLELVLTTPDSGEYVFSMVGPSVLATAGVGGPPDPALYALNTLTVTLPAS